MTTDDLAFVANRGVCMAIERWAEARFSGCGGMYANVGRCEIVSICGSPGEYTVWVDGVPEFAAGYRLEYSGGELRRLVIESRVIKESSR